MAITIIGAGISGLVFGRCLLQRGIRAILLEKNSQTTFTKRNNYGITLHRHAYQPLLKILDIDEAVFKKAVAVDSAVGGTGVINGQGASSFRANRNRFERLLAEGLDVRWESEVERVEDFLEEAGGILVGADGPHSVVRRATAPEVEFEVLNYVAYNGKRRVGVKEFEREMAVGFDGGNVLEQKVGDAVFQVSVSERTAEEVSISWSYSRPARGGEDALFRPRRDKSEAKDIPEALFEEVESLKGRLEGALAFVFDAEKIRGDRMLSWLMRTVEVDEKRLQAAAEKGIILIGDAVHAEPILGGEGANVAIEDGMRLAALLAEATTGQASLFYRDRHDVWSKSVAESKARISSMHGIARSSL